MVLLVPGNTLPFTSPLAGVVVAVPGAAPNAPPGSNGPGRVSAGSVVAVLVPCALPLPAWVVVVVDVEVEAGACIGLASSVELKVGEVTVAPEVALLDVSEAVHELPLVPLQPPTLGVVVVVPVVPVVLVVPVVVVAVVPAVPIRALVCASAALPVRASATAAAR